MRDRQLQEVTLMRDVGKMTSEALSYLVQYEYDQELADAAAEELDMRAQEAHERQSGMGGWR